MKIQKVICGVTVAGVMALLGAPLAQAAQSGASASTQRGQLSESDYRFLEKAARGGMEEVQLGELAQQKGASQTVRSFGQRMVTDHGKANAELKQLAQQKGATLPTDLSHSERSTMTHLSGTSSGADFDRSYARDMVKDHQKDIKEFQHAASKVTDPDLRAWAQKTLPILQQHLSLAESMETSVKHEK